VTVWYDLTPAPRRAAHRRRRLDRVWTVAAGLWAVCCVCTVLVGLAAVRLSGGGPPEAAVAEVESEIAARSETLAALQEEAAALRNLLALSAQSGGQADWSVPMRFFASAADGRARFERLSLRRVSPANEEEPRPAAVAISATGLAASRDRLARMIDAIDGSPVLASVRLDRADTTRDGTQVRFALRATIAGAASMRADANAEGGAP